VKKKRRFLTEMGQTIGAGSLQILRIMATRFLSVNMMRQDFNFEPHLKKLNQLQGIMDTGKIPVPTFRIKATKMISPQLQ
jgi:hypothetical protein